MKVFVYFNLHKKRWSVRALEGPKKNRVIEHKNIVVLKNCTMKVSEAGRQRVLRERRKNVHAGIVGELNQNADWRFDENNIITYNPYKGPDFVKVKTGEPVYKADTVVCSLKYSTGHGYRPLVVTD